MDGPILTPHPVYVAGITTRGRHELPMIRTRTRISLVIRLAVVVVIAAALFFLPRLQGWSGLSAVIIAAFILFTFFLVRWHARHSAYKCPGCECIFAISAWTDFLSPHLSGDKMLRCPHCGLSGWCPEIDRDTAALSPGQLSPARKMAPASPATSLYVQVVVVLACYAAIWIVTLYSRPTGAFPWVILRIPLIVTLLPILHATFCVYAVFQNYRSRIYFFVTLFVAVFLTLALWIQYTVLARFA